MKTNIFIWITVVILVGVCSAVIDFEIQHEDPLTSAGAFEGDIKGVSPSSASNKAAATKRWPGGMVPFEVMDDLDRPTKAALNRAIREIKKETCVKFTHRRGRGRNFVIFSSGGENAKGCSTFVGMKGGTQEAILGPGCGGKGVILHTLMHILGFWHEHARVDRDNHIRVHRNHLKRGTRDYFKKYVTKDSMNGGEPYDTSSIMHHSAKAFAKNNKKSMTATEASAGKLGQRSGLSVGDKRKIKQIYCSAWGSE